MRQFISLTLLLLFPILSKAQLTISKVYIENKVNPLGIDTENPRFTWIVNSDQFNQVQSAFEIRVANSKQNLNSGPYVWQSEKINSAQSVLVDYAGSPLKSNDKYFWQVRLWDNKNKSSDWSEPGFWQMGKLDPAAEFEAKWIGPGYDESDMRPSPLLRSEFTLPNKPILNATAYISALGMYEASLNGTPIGDARLAPGWTSYNNRLQYQMYDVSEVLKPGQTNIAGAMLGSGWYRGYLAWNDSKNHYGDKIGFLFQLEITYADGTSETIVSDEQWKSSESSVLSSEIYDGEMIDSRKEKTGWLSPNFDDQHWVPVNVLDQQNDVLIATQNEAIKEQERLKPLEILKTPEGDTLVDFGQNIVGWIKLNVSGSAGDTITLSHAEVLDKDGNFYTTNLRLADQKMVYVLNGQQNQEFRPHFTFQGFRYVKVEGFPGELNLQNLTAIALYSDMPKTGSFSCSDPLINQLQSNIEWGQKGNFLDVPTDCPQRDERLGWTGDAQAFFRTAAYNMNVHNFFAKWLKDLAADQSENGSVPFVIPNVLGESSGGSAGWADAATIIPWQAYEIYGDKKILESQYPSMKAWVEYIRSNSTDNLWNTGFHFGDWLFYRPDDDNDGRAAVTDKYYITQCFYAHSTQLLINAATVLGKSEDITFYSKLLKEIKEAFLDEFVTPSGRIGPNTQTAYVLALHFDLLPENLRAKAAKRLVENIVRYENHLTTGFLGTPYLCHVLTRFGYNDVAYDLLMQKTYPSWLYPVTMGATTIWERWDGIKPDGSFQTPGMNSFNHYAYGAIGDWMYKNMAGIDQDSSSTGYKSITIYPKFGGDITWVEGKLQTYYGEIMSSWKINENQFEHQVRIPFNSKANITLPTENPDKVTINGKSLEKSKLVQSVSSKNQQLVLTLGSGNYQINIMK